MLPRDHVGVVQDQLRTRQDLAAQLSIFGRYRLVVIEVRIEVGTLHKQNVEVHHQAHEAQVQLRTLDTAATIICLGLHPQLLLLSPGLQTGIDESAPDPDYA